MTDTPDTAVSHFTTITAKLDTILAWCQGINDRLRTMATPADRPSPSPDPYTAIDQRLDRQALRQSRLEGRLANLDLRLTELAGADRIWGDETATARLAAVEKRATEHRRLIDDGQCELHRVERRVGAQDNHDTNLAERIRRLAERLAVLEGDKADPAA